jgi:hypothetical protein
MTLEFKYTVRGFARYDFKDLYGNACSLQESSLATDNAIWLGCNEQRMHLNRNQVAALLPILQNFVAVDVTEEIDPYLQTR